MLMMALAFLVVGMLGIACYTVYQAIKIREKFVMGQQKPDKH